MQAHWAVIFRHGRLEEVPEPFIKSLLHMHVCPQNDLEFLRIRSFKHEIMVAASKFLEAGGVRKVPAC